MLYIGSGGGYGYGYCAGCCIDRGRGEEGVAGGDRKRGYEEEKEKIGLLTN